MKPLGSVAAVVAAIREDAAGEVEAIARQADADIARLRADDAAQPVTFAEGDVQVAAARDGARARLAQEDWLDSRAAIEEREAWLAQVTAIGHERIGLGATAEIQGQRLDRLIQESITRLPSTAVEVVVSAADAALLDEAWRERFQLAHRLESLAITVGAIAGGCLVRTGDGRASYDNTYAARSERFRNAWRAALAEVYERAVQPRAHSATSDVNRT